MPVPKCGAVERSARWGREGARRPLAFSVAVALLLACGCRPGAQPPPAPAGESPSAGGDAPGPAMTSAASRVPTPAPTFVWADTSGAGRAQVVWFRRDLELGAAPREATLQLFASSRYLLFVNGAVVASGPARSYPERPEFDSVELGPHLVTGHNSIAVQVLSFGTSSFQLRRQPGAFVAWGAVRAGDAVFDLSTPGAWKCARDRGYDETAPRLSFAMPPIEVYDARRAGIDWLGGVLASSDSELAAVGWGAPLPLATPEAWGELAPRSIPPLEARFIAPKALLGAYALDDSERLLSFRVPVPDQSRAEYASQHLLFARTRIFSPRAQRVPFGLWWGSYYVNGRGPLENAGLSPGQRNRNLVWVALSAGWNDFFVRYKSVFGSWDFYLSVPRDAGLEFSARGAHGDRDWFESAGPFPPDTERELERLAMPLAPEAAPKPSGPRLPAEIEWRAHAGGERSANPALEVSWRRVGAELPLDAAPTHEIPIAARRDTALVFDLGGTQLGRLRVDYDGPAGSTLDFAWAEELSERLPAVLRQHGLFTGARHVSAGGASRFETIKPYGMRYLQLNVSRHSAPLKIQRLGLVRELYPFEGRGRFESSDPALDALWKMGERTLRVCAEDSYVDTPFRERGLYAGDLLVQVAVTLATSGDLRLAKRSLRLLRGMYRDLFVPGAARHPDEIGLLEDYPLLGLETYAWVVEATGDLAFARELFADYRQLVDAVLARRRPDGSVTNETVFVEWVLPESERHAVENTAYHALLARALSSLARVARRLGEAELAARYDAEAQAVARALQARFWDAQAGAFLDGTRAGARSRSHLPASSAWPSLWGLTTAAQESALRGFWQREIGPGAPRSARVSPYGGFFLLGALYRHGQEGLAEDYMRRYWAPMLADPEGTLWEHFDRQSGTSSHAWSAAPTYYLSTQVLGVQLGYPEAALGTDLLIAPQAESLSWARGTVPHPRGDIAVDWRIEGDLLRLSVSVPEGLRYRVEPRGRLAELRLELNGHLQASKPSPSSRDAGVSRRLPRARRRGD
jgi:alpha-L-rhamnosidase